MKNLERERFPTVPVENTVFWVNPSIHMPFSLEEGKPADLGVFLINPQDNSTNYIDLEVDRIHGRSAFLGSIRTTDTNGTVYRDIDISGVGYCSNNTNLPLQISPVSLKDEVASWGIRSLHKTIRERDITENLIGKGVRTNRTGAIIKLAQIALPDGKLISVEEAKAQGLIPEQIDPVAALRFYRVRERIDHPQSIKEELLHDAKNAVSNELGRNLDWDEYLIWFATAVGNQLAAIHKAGYWHGFPKEHNITLAAEIIDFGFSESSKLLRDYKKDQRFRLRKADFKDATSGFVRLMSETKHLGYTSNEGRVESLRQIEKAYNETFGNKPGEAYFLAPFIHDPIDFFSPKATVQKHKGIFAALRSKIRI